MKKNFKFYIIAWGTLLALFNLITFIVPAIPGVEKYTASFWVGYIFITLAFIGQLGCAFMVFKHDEHRMAFYNIPLINSSFIGLAATFIAGFLCMIIPFPYWLSVIICIAVLAVNAFAVLKAKVAVDAVASIDKNVKEKTFFIKSLTIDAETLEASAGDDAIKAECHKVAEALKYSDPMSSDALSSVEGQITVKFADLSAAVAENDKEKTITIAKEVIVLIGDRNKKCKLLK